MWPRFRATYGLDLRVSIQKKVSKVCLKSNRIWIEEGQDRERPRQSSFVVDFQNKYQPPPLVKSAFEMPQLLHTQCGKSKNLLLFEKNS